MAVMNGLQGGYIDALLEVSSFHLRLGSRQAARPAAEIEEARKLLSGLPGLRSILPFRESMVLVQAEGGRLATLRLLALPPNFAELDPGFARELGIDGSALARGGLVLGGEAARSLGLRSGRRLELLLPSTSLEEGLRVERLELPLAETFSSGFWQFDSGLALVSESLLPPALLKDGAWSPLLGIKLKDRSGDQAFALEAGTRLRGAGLGDLSLESWRDYNRAFFGALATEKAMMFLLLGLVFLVVAINIHHAMRRIVALRAEDMALLRSLGAGELELSAVFAWNGLLTGLKGALGGLLLGSFVAVNINELIIGGADLLGRLAALLARVFPVLPPPPSLDSIFYLQELPVRLELPETLLIVFLAAASSLLAALSASRELARQRPAEILRHE